MRKALLFFSLFSARFSMGRMKPILLPQTSAKLARSHNDDGRSKRAVMKIISNSSSTVA